MTPTDRARLEVAYQAYQRAQPSDFEVSTSAHRILARMRERAPRHHRRRMPLVGVGILLAGALSYAATEAGRYIGQSSSEPRLEAALAPGEPLRQGTVRLPDTPSTRPVSGIDALEPNDGDSAKLDSPRFDGPSGSAAVQDRAADSVATTASADAQARSTSASGVAARQRASWNEVATALDAGDEHRAERVLGRMVEDEDRRERAKAQLGLSQLALGRGDCSAALVHAQAVLTNPKGAFLHARARSIVTECTGAAPPPRVPVKD